MTERSIRICMPLIFIFALSSCATLGHTAGVEELFVRGEGRLPLALLFPEALTDRDDSVIAALEVKSPREPIESWRLARYHHVESARAGHFEKALVYYRELVGDEKYNSVFAENNIACLYAETGRLADSEKALKALIGGKPGVIAAYYNLYIIYRHARRESDSLLVLQRMREAYPRSVFVNNELGNVFFEQEDYEQAAMYFTRSLKDSGDNHIALYGMARTMERLGSDDEAERYYRICVDKHPYFHEAYLDFSAMLIRLNRKEEAGRLLLKEMKKFKNAERP